MFVLVGVCVRVFVCDVVGDCVGVLDSVRWCLSSCSC